MYFLIKYFLYIVNIFKSSVLFLELSYDVLLLK